MIHVGREDWFGTCGEKHMVRVIVCREKKRGSVYMGGGLSVKVDCRVRAAPGFCW